MTIRRLVLVILGCILLPSFAHAQAAIAGVAKDSSGGVLPGVTVEASSPALIDKSRSAITDSAGLYKIENLRPGTYTVVFTLAGFNTSRREGVELTGSFTASINAELKVGSVEESITVTGETPVVDLQSATKQRVMDAKVISEIPTGRVFANLAVLVPGVSQSNAPDVGGSLGANMTDLIAHGSRASDFRATQNGVSLSTNAGGRAGAVPNMTAYEQVAVDSGSVDASQALGGPRVNFIPRDGGNTTKGTGYFGFANSGFQSSNFTSRLKAQGLTTPNSIIRLWDFNPGIGGPLRKDTLWYYATYRNQGAYNNVGGMFYNKNANNPTAWAYVPDLNNPAADQQLWEDMQARVTLQASRRNKIAFSVDFQDINDNWPFGCDCIRAGASGGAVTLTSPEGNNSRRFPFQRALQGDWTNPLSNHILLEAVGIQRVERDATDDIGGGGRPMQLTDTSIISVTDRGGPIPGLTYRAPATYGNVWMWTLYYRAAVSYITGSHAFKVGFDSQQGHNDSATTVHQPVSYTFNSPAPDANGNYKPTPSQLTLRVAPTQTFSGYGPQLGAYIQDKWTKSRLTASYGLRYDHFGATIRANSFQPTQLAPGLNLSFPEEPGLNWNDLSPRLSAVYDLLGNGKTAIKVSANRYLSNQTNFTSGGQFTNVVTSTTRTWADANGNYIPDCNLTNPQKNGECNTDANTGFGTYVANSAKTDPNINNGWFHRSYNWEFSVGLQQQVAPRVSLDVSYFRRIYGNFTATDNLALAQTDFSAFSVTAPNDSRLNSAGQVISGLYDLSPAKQGVPSQNYTTFSDNYGKQIEHWNGLDISANARLQNGLLVQGGVSTGRAVTDNCQVVAALPEMLVSGSTVTSASYCHSVAPFQTQIKMITSYTIPRVDVLLSGTYQSIPGPALAANRTYTSAEIAPSLGRALSAGATSTDTINLVAPGSLYGERVNQIDFRIGKVLKLGRSRTRASFDLYNLTNGDTVITENSSYTTAGAWRVPTTTLQARLAKISLQWDF